MKRMLVLLISLMLVVAISACGFINNEEPILPDATEEPLVKTVNIYFPDNNVMYMEAEERIIEGRDDIEFVKAIIDEILKGPVSEKLNPAIRGDVKLLAVSIDEKGLCTVNLSEEFETHNTGGSAMESMAIYSIVNSLCGLDSIDKVKINIAGNIEAEFGGHFYMGDPFEPDKNLICP